MAQPSSTSSSSSSPDANLLQLTVKTALAQIEKHAPQKDRALLRAMIEYAPSDQGRLSIAGHILQSVDAENDFDDRDDDSVGGAKNDYLDGSSNILSSPSPPAPPITPPGTVPTVPAALPPAPPLPAADPLVSAALPAAMHTDSSRSSSNGCYVPVLTKANFLKWQVCVVAYLTPHDHVRVIDRVNIPGRGWVDPIAPTDARPLEAWLHSERVARGIIVSTAVDLHLELVHKHRQGNPWILRQAIEAKHVKQDASFRHGAWMSFLGIRHGLDEPYVDFLNRITDARAQIDRVTPPGLSFDERMDELLLFTALCGMRTDDPLRRQLVAQKNICLDDVMACFLRTDQDASISAWE